MPQNGLPGSTSSLTPSTSYATFDSSSNATPARGYPTTSTPQQLSVNRSLGAHLNSSDGQDDNDNDDDNSDDRQQRHQQQQHLPRRRARSMSRILHNNSRRRFSRTSESGRSRRYHSRTSATFILTHPSTSFEVISAYSPRVSGVAAVPDEEYDNVGVFDDDEDDSEDDDLDMPYGVRKMELLQLKPYTVWLGVLFITCWTSLSSTITPTVEPFLVSLYGGHSYISSIAVATSIAYAVCKPPMAKIIDVFGRAEGLALSAILYLIGYLLTSSSRSIITFGIGRVIGSAGAQGIGLAQQVILADITTLASRGFFVSTVFTPWLIAPWIGPPIGQLLKDIGEPGWRLAYTLSGIVVSVSCLALIFMLWSSYRRMLRISKLSESAISALKDQHPRLIISESLVWQPRNAMELAKEVRSELDLRGNFYLMVGCTLLLLPLSLAANRPKAWHDPLFPLLAVLGLAFLGLLGYHEAYVAQHPLIPTRLLKRRTVMAGCFLGAFHFFCQFAYESYFPSFLQVARSFSARDASYISESYVFSASIAALLCGVLVKWTHSYKIWMVVGVLLHIVGAIMMVRFRSLDTTTAEIVLSQIISGLGGGFTTLGVQLGVQAVVAHQDMAIVTAIFLTITQIGGAVGGAVSGIIWTTWLPKKLAEYLPNASPEELSQIFGSMSVALSYEPGTPERIGINQAYYTVQRMLNLAALLGLLPALISALMMENVRMSHDTSADKQRILPMGDVIDESDDEEEGQASNGSVLSFEDTPLRRAARG